MVENDGAPPNPLEPTINLERQSTSRAGDETTHPQRNDYAEDSAVTRAEKYERRGGDEVVESLSKKRKLEPAHEHSNPGPAKRERPKGVAPIKAE